MADITAILTILIIFGLAFPGLLTAWWLLFPALVGRSAYRLERSPWKAFWSGAIVLALALIPIVILLALPFGPAKFLGWAGALVLLAFSSLGSAGLAAHLGARLAQRSAALSPAAAFVGGAFILEMAVLFPLIGWLLVFPLTVFTSFGAVLLAFVKRTAPEVEAAPVQTQDA
ncbi:MAG: hypothetical protein IPN59_13335 [Holophaga sp.]|nr:hypothetical protein [Holophaga sp.]